VAGLQNGIVVNHLVNWLSPLKERTTVITGEKGTFVVDTLTSDLTYYENGRIQMSQEQLAHFKGVSQGDVRTFAFEKPEALKTEHQNFRDAVLGLDSAVVTLESGCRTVKVAEAVIASFKSQSRVSP
jgi:predicted dehydrogenase